ncbi:hypothetical protein R4P47_08180 [Rhodococcus sp. IEGM 1370]|uniref:hypothetical protein n=1 Tax=Rhodococcus sp. IEGM 1370 TaxID=3082222 RepID=UPI002953D5AE|nr:hypothetical protein [Rhodococcus sp. IEGM 1370]MDV8076532.1 hypothetical protein [Rhodococcus sp. IEGM 1370]
MAVDPVWAGVVGTAVGAVAGSAASLLAPLINWRTERQRLVVEKENAKELAEQQHALELSRIARENEAVNLEGKRAQIAVWRNGVAEALAEWTAEDQLSVDDLTCRSVYDLTCRCPAGS